MAVDNSPILIEGNYSYTRTVVIQFNSKTDFEAWYNSNDYQRILKHRLSGADCDSVLIKGLD